MTEYSACAKFSRGYFIILNILFVVFGSGFIGFGSYLLNLGSEHDYDVITGNQFVSGAALLVAAGVFTFIVAVIGIIGAIFMLRPLLIIYVLIVVLLVILEIAAGIIGFVFRDTVTEEVEERMTNAFLDYTSGPDDPEYKEDVNDVVAYVQDNFECCGVNGSEDWIIHHLDIVLELGQLPRECLCNGGTNCVMGALNISADDSPNLEVDSMIVYSAWDRGCLEVVEDNLDTVAIVIGVLGVIIGLIEISGIAMAIGLVICIHNTKKDTFV